MKLESDSKVNNFFILLIGIQILLIGCQTFPEGERLSEIQEEYQQVEIPDLSTTGIYRYYMMCRASWRQRDVWMESGWDLHYFHGKETDTLGLFILEDEILYIIFRSSRALLRDPEDSFFNRQISLDPVPFLPDTGIEAHRGYIEKYMSVRGYILQELAESNPKEVVLVGYSAGGSIASLAFMDLKHLYPDTPVNGITFGMVRVFNKEGALWYRSFRDNFIRVVNGRDFIPNLPPALFGYRHIGRLVRIGNRPLLSIFSVKDHHPGYITSLEELLQQEGIEPSKLSYYK